LLSSQRADVRAVCKLSVVMKPQLVWLIVAILTILSADFSKLSELHWRLECPFPKSQVTWLKDMICMHKLVDELIELLGVLQICSHCTFLLRIDTRTAATASPVQFRRVRRL